MRHRKRVLVRPLLIWALLLGFTIAASWVADEMGRALSTSAQGTIFSPSRIGGASGYEDPRDADLYPTVAYDPISGRYLAVWLTARNASSSSDGLDVYGVLLDGAGQPVGREFRISDSNSAARNGPPTVAAGKGEFAVGWTARDGMCQIFVQRVTDAVQRADQPLVSGTGHRHSPSLVYNPARQRYALAYVVGDDYLPPTVFGAETGDCGNNASSASGIQVTEFFFDGDSLVTGTMLDVSDLASGAFRPYLAYSHLLGQYLVAWEDRRDADGETYRFDVYARGLSGDMILLGSELALVTGGDYTNDDTSATWTPRPAVAGGDDQFLVMWFSRDVAHTAVIWSAEGSLVSGLGARSPAFPVAHMLFAQSHAGQPPTGFLSAAYADTAEEYLVGMTSHLESLWGYISFARIQRVSRDGQLLKLDGSPQSAPGVGYSVDYENDDQIAIGLAVNRVSGSGTADYLAVYAKHRMDQTAQDFDIWGVRFQIPTPPGQSVYLPFLSKE